MPSPDDYLAVVPEAGLTLLYSATAGAGGVASFDTGTVDLSSYTSLKIVISARSDDTAAAGGAGVFVWYNGDETGTNYLASALVGGQTTSNVDIIDTFLDSNVPLFVITNANAPAGVLSFGVAWIGLTDTSHYTSSTSQSMNFRGVAPGTFRLLYMYARTWKNTDAVTQITLKCASGGDFVEGSTVQIFGVK